MGKENKTQSNTLLTIFALLVIVILIIYNIYTGLTVKKIGIPGIFEIEFGTRTPTGSISVVSDPESASIFLDGSYKGTTPATIKNVEVGSYTITLQYQGYQDWSDNITVRANQITSVPWINLKRYRLTESTMSGDAVLHYRIVSKSKTQLTIDVDYTYNRLHGEVVYIGAVLLYKEHIIGNARRVQVPTVESGTARLTVVTSIKSESESDELEVFLVEQYKDPFVRRSFPFEDIWEPSG